MNVSPSVIVLSLVVFLPAVGALVVGLLPSRSEELIKRVGLAFTVAVFALTVWMAIPAPIDGPPPAARFSLEATGMQQLFSLNWIPKFNIYYALGLDGISFPLVLLTSFISMLAMWASWPIDRHVKAYTILFLLLEGGMLGVFLAVDFFLFYVFWEVMLLPMYFLIGVWGGPRREYAAIKFFLFTLAGSVLMLVALLMLYFNSDLKTLSRDQVFHECQVNPELKALYDTSTEPIHTFNLLAWAKMGQLPDSPFNKAMFCGKSIQWWAFLLLLVGFIIKVPSVPLHTWLPDAHVEAPTPISMILAGVLLKMGGYGILRVCYPVCPVAARELAWLVVGLGVVSMVYGAFAAMAQKDFKRLVAYSSVSHMGYVLLGIGIWSAAAGSYDYWKQGISGAMFQMIAHGLSSAGMFFLVGVVYDRVHHRELDRFGGLFARMPTYSGLAMVIFFAALGLPGLCGFIGEVFVVLAAWSYSQTLAVIAASVVILTAGYILWTIQRVYLGPEYKGPHTEALTPATPRELAIISILLVFCVVLGVYPNSVLQYTDNTVAQFVDDLSQTANNVERNSFRSMTAGEVERNSFRSMTDEEREIYRSLIARMRGARAIDSPLPGTGEGQGVRAVGIVTDVEPASGEAHRAQEASPR